MDILMNPIVVSVIVMSVICLLKMNVLLAVIVAAIVAGTIGGMSIEDTVGSLINGMGGNSETALSYILLGALAVAIGRSGLAGVASRKITQVVGNKKIAFVFFNCLCSLFLSELNSCTYRIHSYFNSATLGINESYEFGSSCCSLCLNIRS